MAKLKIGSWHVTPGKWAKDITGGSALEKALKGTGKRRRKIEEQAEKVGKKTTARKALRKRSPEVEEANRAIKKNIRRWGGRDSSRSIRKRY